MSAVVRIPKIDDDPHYLRVLARVAREIYAAPGGVTLDFSSCSFLKPAAVAVLGGLIVHRNVCGFSTEVDHSKIPKGINEFLRGVAFPAVLPGCSYQSSSAVPFHHHQHVGDVFDSARYLRENWFPNCWVGMTDGLRGRVASNVIELIINGHEHGASVSGVFSFGQRINGLSQTAISFVDFGHGIPARVRAFLDARSMGAPEALEWAFESGNSTIVGEARGLGLGTLRSFVTANHGQIQVLSGHGTGVICDGGCAWGTSPYDFPGTCVTVRLRNDGRSYALAGEVREGPIEWG